VALAEDRNRRADTPDEGNRCYAEPAPRQRDMVYQADYCYSPDFAACSVFLAWAARNAAEPAYVTEAAQKAWSSGIALPEDGGSVPAGTDDADELPVPTPESGLFGPAEPDEPGQATGSDQLDWVSAGAWAEAPWDERAEMEADELEALEAEEPEEEEPEETLETPEEATQAPKVPAALPMRRRKQPQAPIKSRGSGEWHYADPPGHEPLVRRRAGITAPVMLGVLALLVVSIVVFLVATQIGGGGGEQQSAAAPSPSLDASSRPVATRVPAITAAPSLEPSPTPAPAVRTYTVRAGDVLSLIAAKPRYKVDAQLLQCINRIKNPNMIQPGQVLRIPPDGYECPKGWRKSTPEPIE
jgi:nucleoid-associated protein YgaU